MVLIRFFERVLIRHGYAVRPCSRLLRQRRVLNIAAVTVGDQLIFAHRALFIAVLHLCGDIVALRRELTGCRLLSAIYAARELLIAAHLVFLGDSRELTVDARRFGTGFIKRGRSLCHPALITVLIDFALRRSASQLCRAVIAACQRADRQALRGSGRGSFCCIARRSCRGSDVAPRAADAALNAEDSLQHRWAFDRRHRHKQLHERPHPVVAVASVVRNKGDMIDRFRDNEVELYHHNGKEQRQHQAEQRLQNFFCALSA